MLHCAVSIREGALGPLPEVGRHRMLFLHDRPSNFEGFSGIRCRDGLGFWGLGRPHRLACFHATTWRRLISTHVGAGEAILGVRIRGTLGDIDPLNKVPFKRARIRVQKGPPLRGLLNTT